jgi:hypothetical protein
LGTLFFALLLVLAAVTWAAGVLYWKCRISTAVESLRNNPADFNATHQLLAAKGRSIPILLREVQDSLKARDQKMIGTWAHVLAEISVLGRGGGSTYFEIPAILPSDTEAAVNDKCARIFDWWERNKTNYPPWWQFWDGARKVPSRNG